MRNPVTGVLLLAAPLAGPALAKRPRAGGKFVLAPKPDPTGRWLIAADMGSGIPRR